MAFFSFSDAEWTTPDDAAALVAKAATHDGAVSPRASLRVRVHALPMYTNVRLVCFTDDSWEPGLRVCYLEMTDGLWRLVGKSPPIHEVNAKAPVRLTDDNVLYYLSFFCFFVRGEEGPFFIVHSLDDELLPPGFARVKSTKAPDGFTPEELFRSPRVIGRGDGDVWRLSALVCYSNAVFLTDFLVSPTGMIEMAQDQALIADLPVRVTAPLSSRVHGDGTPTP
jgi:hypothetical protein